MKCTMWRVWSIIMKYLCMVTDDNQTNNGDHFEMYRNIESLCCVPETNRVLYISYTSKTNSQNKISDLWLPEVGGGGKGHQMKVVKRYKLPVIRQISTQEVEHDKDN